MRKNKYGPYGNLNISGKPGTSASINLITNDLKPKDFREFLNDWVEPGMRKHLFFAYYKLNLISWNSCEGHCNIKKNTILDMPRVGFLYPPKVAKWLNLKTINRIHMESLVRIEVRDSFFVTKKEITINTILPDTITKPATKYLIIARKQLFDALILLEKIKNS